MYKNAANVMNMMWTFMLAHKCEQEGVAIIHAMSDLSGRMVLQSRTPKLTAEFLKRADDPDNWYKRRDIVAGEPPEASHLQMVVGQWLFTFPKDRQAPSRIHDGDGAEDDGPNLNEMTAALESIETWRDLDFNVFVTPEGMS